MPKHKIIPAVFLVLRKENKVLLAKRQNTGFEDGNYYFISGHLNGGETVKEAIIREAKEEAGIKIKAGDLEVVHIINRKSGEDEYLDIFLTTYDWTGEPTNCEPEKCSGIKWFPEGGLPKNTSGLISFAMDNIENLNFYSEYGWGN